MGSPSATSWSQTLSLLSWSANIKRKSGLILHSCLELLKKMGDILIHF